VEIDLSDSEASEVVEGLKRAPALDADEGEQEGSGADVEEGEPSRVADPAGEADAGGPAPDRGADAIDAEELDEAVGRLWMVFWGGLASYLDEEELKEEREHMERAKDALGPLARKHIPAQLQKMGPEAIAFVFVAERVSSKIDHL
jgi:hypothetical protein